ncbi:MAG: RES family NAD+ phosphorylase [Steroidobacteraceae bacterium]
MLDIRSVPLADVAWRPAFRLVPSRFPPVGVWERIAGPADFDALAELEGLTNPRIREEMGTLALIPRERWAAGPGTTPIMAAFTHLNPEGSRFSDGRFGIFYASATVETAIRETVFHREQFLKRTREPPMQLPMRCYATVIECCLHDIRGGFPALHDPDDYSASQQAGGKLRAANSDGVVYDSVRHRGGFCAAIFWPDRVGPCVQTRHFSYAWDGTSITGVLELTEVRL